MGGVTIYEFGVLVSQYSCAVESEELQKVPLSVFEWLEALALTGADKGNHAWLRLNAKARSSCNPGHQLCWCHSRSGRLPD